MPRNVVRRPLRLLGLLGLSALLGCAPREAPGTSAGAAVAAMEAPAKPPAISDSARVTHRPDGTVLVSGQPYFPFGFYHLSWAGNGSVSQRLADLHKLSDGGFNLMLTEAVNDTDVATFLSFLDEAQRDGVHILTYGLKPDTIRRTAQHPAVLGFTTSDDANHLITPGDLSQKNALFRQLAPNKLTYISLSVGYDRPESAYFGLSDMVGNQSYPIGDDSIAVVYPTMRITVTQALARGVTPLANLQTFAWKPGGPRPNPQELTNMTYQALMAGVKGVLYYAYRSREVDLNTVPQSWDALSRLAGETRQLAPALMDGQRTELANGRGKLPLVVTFDAPQGRYLLALNNDRTQVRTVAVNLPRSAGRMTAQFGRGDSLTLRAGPAGNAQVVGQLAPLEVQVYKLN